MLVNQPATFIKIVISYSLIGVIIFFLSCHTTNVNRSHLKGINLIANYPVVLLNKEEIKFFNLLDTIGIFYFNNYILYRLPPGRRLETNERIKGTEPYFIYQEKSKYGFLFRALNDSSRGIKLPVDSFLFKRAFAGITFDIPSDSLWSLFTTMVNEKNNSSFEKYVPRKQGDETSIDSIYYYFTGNLKNIDYSFSKKIDSLKGMKLYEVRLLYNEKFSPTYKAIIPKREIWFKIEKSSTSNIKEITCFFERFRKNRLSLSIDKNVP